MDPLLGRAVEIRSTAGIPYRGIVLSIRESGELGELFELGSHDSSTYRRLVHVSDRARQIVESGDVGQEHGSTS